jgi:transposase
VTNLLRVFRVDAHRSREAFERLFGPDFSGTLVSDRLASYDGLEEDVQQLCWAHLKRDFQGFADRGDLAAQEFGRRGLKVVHTLFEEWHAFQEAHGDRGRLRRRLRGCRRDLTQLLIEGAEGEDARIAGFSNHLIERAGALWTFTEVDGVEPTNNPAERALRPAVLWRKGCFGSQSDSGCRFVERVLTIVATLRTQGRAGIDFLIEACTAPLHGSAPPSLIPQAP